MRNKKNKHNTNKQIVSLFGGICIPWQGVFDQLCLGSPATRRSLGNTINDLMPYVFAISGIVLLLMIVFSGYQLLTSAGNPEGMEKGKKRLTAALVGFILIFAAFWIYQLIGVLIGYDFTNPPS